MHERITVLNPLGQPPPVYMSILAPRLTDLKGKTIYVVDVKFPASKIFFEELVKALKEKFPETNFVACEKEGTYFDDDPRLWAEIKEKADGMVMFVGH